MNRLHRGSILSENPEQSTKALLVLIVCPCFSRGEKSHFSQPNFIRLNLNLIDFMLYSARTQKVPTQQTT